MLEKVKDFFSKIFGIKRQKLIGSTTYKTLSNDDFENRIVFDNSENEKAIKLQRDFKAGLIKEENMLPEDIELVANLYRKQIEETEKSIQTYKQKIMQIRAQLNKANQ